MKYLNRSAIVIKYKAPFLEWLNLDLKGNHDNLVYLLEGFDDLYHLEEIIKSHYESIFNDILKGFCKDKSKLPEKLSWELFHEWFEINAHSRVKDLETSPIEYVPF